MQLGWIDFSDTDRKKALGILTMMDEEGAVDEIGIGRIRDAFANIFFPGTSTIMTRAKYYFIVPYAFKDALANRNLTKYKEIIKEVEDGIERKCAEKMLKKNPGSGNGIIGARSLARGEWVSRKPSSIYWNALRTVGMFTYENISTIESYVKVALANRDNIIDKTSKSDDEEDDRDDSDAFHRKMKPFWNLPEGGYNKRWITDISIDLTFDEADFLRNQISTRYQDTLFKVMLDNNIRLPERMFFGDATELFFDKVSPRNKHLITLANKVNLLVYMIRVRYNIMLTRGLNQNVLDAWEDLKNETEYFADLDIRQMMYELKVYDTQTRIFLEGAKSFLLGNRIDELDRLIYQREVALKGQRSKLAKANEYDPRSLVADYWLDFRMNTARTIINDILDAEQRNENDI